MINSVVSIKLFWYIIVIVHSLLPFLSFTFLPIITWCAPYHIFCLGECLLVPFSPIFISLAFVAVDDLVTMWIEISLWMPFWNISLPPYFWFFFKCLVCLSLVSCSILDQACNGGCSSFVGICQFFCLNKWTGRFHTIMINMKVQGCPVLKKHICFLRLYGCHD